MLLSLGSFLIYSAVKKLALSMQSHVCTPPETRKCSVARHEEIEMSGVHQFVWGFLGSLAVEIVDANELFHAERVTIPERYKFIAYWLVRFGLAVMGGFLAIACGTQSPYAAMAIGAAAPLVIRALPYIRNGRGPGTRTSTVVTPIRAAAPRKEHGRNSRKADEAIKRPAA
jgi:hypothetical protein